MTQKGAGQHLTYWPIEHHVCQKIRETLNEPLNYKKKKKKREKDVPIMKKIYDDRPPLTGYHQISCTKMLTSSILYNLICNR